MEIYTNEKDADAIVSISKGFGIDAQVIGRVEGSTKKELMIKTKSREIVF